MEEQHALATHAGRSSDTTERPSTGDVGEESECRERKRRRSPRSVFSADVGGHDADADTGRSKARAAAERGKDGVKMVGLTVKRATELRAELLLRPHGFLRVTGFKLPPAVRMPSLPSITFTLRCVLVDRDNLKAACDFRDQNQDYMRRFAEVAYDKLARAFDADYHRAPPVLKSPSGGSVASALLPPHRHCLERTLWSAGEEPRILHVRSTGGTASEARLRGVLRAVSAATRTHALGPPGWEATVHTSCPRARSDHYSKRSFSKMYYLVIVYKFLLALNRRGRLPNGAELDGALATCPGCLERPARYERTQDSPTAWMQAEPCRHSSHGFEPTPFQSDPRHQQLTLLRTGPMAPDSPSPRDDAGTGCAASASVDAHHQRRRSRVRAAMMMGASESTPRAPPRAPRAPCAGRRSTRGRSSGTSRGWGLGVGPGVVGVDRRFGVE